MLRSLCRCENFGEGPTVAAADRGEKEASALPLKQKLAFHTAEVKPPPTPPPLTPQRAARCVLPEALCSSLCVPAFLGAH